MRRFIPLALSGRVVDQRTGRPIANADVSILGLTGSVKTDAEGRFSWKPDPTPPFEVLVILPNGALARPILVERIGGAELTFEIDPAVAEQITVSGAALDSISPATFTALLRKQFGARAFAQGRVGWYADDDRPGPTEREVNGYTLLDAAAGVQIGRRVELRAQARNLLDEAYFASQDVRAVLAPGRSASLTVALVF